MDGENNGKPYKKWMIWRKTHYFRKHPDDELLPTASYIMK